MEQSIATQSVGSLNQKRRFPITLVCGIIALLLVGGTFGFVWTVNLNFKPAHSMYMDFRATEVSLIQLLDEYDAFRESVPEDPKTWGESQHARNGQFNLAINKLQHKYMLKIRAYNFVTREISDFFFAVGLKINSVEIPKKIILPTD